MPKELTGTDISCFFCNLEEPDSLVRRNEIKNYFRNMHLVDDQELILVLSGLWRIAMTESEEGELPSLGLFECMASLIDKGIKDRDWLHRNQNIYIPYYAAHIVGSYTMNNVDLAVKAVEAGTIPPLLDLLRGNMSWVEQRVAVRALGHLASYERTFEAVSTYEEEVVKVAMHLASTCVEVVYNMFVGVKDKNKRLKYHCDLLTRGAGLGDMETENRKAEEWASQLQCWCLNLLNCFAIKGMSLDLICKPSFLQELCEMWGQIANGTSPSGIGLIRLLCHSKVGRRCIAETENVIENLCNLSRSSDDWQYMGIDCLLLLLKDPDTEYKVMEASISCLIDLIEVKNLGGRANVGEIIKRTLCDLKLRNSKAIMSPEVQRALEELRNIIIKRRNEKAIPDEKKDEQRVLVALIKQQGNHCFSIGRIQEAINKYTEAIELCPLRLKKERIVLYSNRAQGYLLQREPDAAISDTTRALCLSNPPNSHLKSLWRRSQAYDMKGLARESLMDCIMFINGGIRSKDKKQLKVPHEAVRMISKQMDSTWLFKAAQSKMISKYADTTSMSLFDVDRIYLEKLPNLKISPRNKGCMTAGLPTISEEPLLNWKEKRNAEGAEGSKESKIWFQY
ncbi:OLC1v1016939C1 [Oldenlandia corymbosa var. corymbosa]|uniref:OLC1v1016939C1 n=1 Tax=Oldenlandia corymbosa var. corymbosa TaxID=529605 RepID=A0AAV1E8B4_OLDCO|nr:OLC1v1016939C1 [Oldenlandia corymbosa var. corymbosa]